MKSFLIKVNDSYYAGEHEDTTPTPRPGSGWYCNRGDSNVIFFENDRLKAKEIESLINLNSHWQRIYNAMKYDGLEAWRIEIIEI